MCWGEFSQARAQGSAPSFPVSLPGPPSFLGLALRATVQPQSKWEFLSETIALGSLDRRAHPEDPGLSRKRQWFWLWDWTHLGSIAAPPLTGPVRSPAQVTSGCPSDCVSLNFRFLPCRVETIRVLIITELFRL